MKIRKEDLTYSDVTAPALVVETERDWRMLFWQRAQYIPFWDIKGIWVNSEWLETIGDASGEYGFEPLHDKGCRFSRVEPLLCTEAVSRVRWHYALNSTRYEVFHGDGGADEFFTIFPAGYCLRQLVANPGKANNFGGNPLFWEVAEVILINPKGILPTDYLSEHVASFFNLEGDTYQRYWCKDDFLKKEEKKVPYSFLCREHPSSSNWREFIIRLHFKDNRPEPFLIIPNSQDLFPHTVCTICGSDHPTFHLWESYPIWSHWPAYEGTDYAVLIPGTKEEAQKRATHSSVVSIGPWYGQWYSKMFPKAYPAHAPEVWTFPEGTSWHFLFGVTNESNESLMELASSWLHPAVVEEIDGATFVGYDFAQMAYCFDVHLLPVKFHLNPKVVCKNPFFLFTGWKGAEKPSLLVGGTTPDLSCVRCEVKGGTLYLWIERTFKSLTAFCIR